MKKIAMYRPTTTEEAIQILSRHGTEAAVYAGGTDLLIRLKNRLEQAPSYLVDIKKITDNLNVGPADFDEYTVTAPLHPDLPGGGGYSFTALNIKPAKFTQLAQNYLTFASDDGSQTAYWHGVDVSINARPRNRLVLSTGTSTGRGVQDNCDIVTAFNSNTGTAFNSSFGMDGATWNRPTTILNPRAVRFNVTVSY